MEVMSASHSDLGGFSEVTAMLSGDAVWTRMKHEAGTHRVQRVPVTESQGRAHLIRHGARDPRGRRGRD